MRPRAVTAEQIVDGADRVARRCGIDSLTVRALCAELGVTAPAVYRHFPSKDLIVDEVVDRVIARTKLPGPEVGDWADRLRVCFVSVHDEVAPYAGLAARMGREMPKSPAAQRNGDYLREVLAGAGVDEPTAEKIIFATFVYSWGHLLADGVPNPVTGEKYDEADSRRQFLWGLGHLLDSFRREVDDRGRRRDPSSRGLGRVEIPHKEPKRRASQGPSRGR